MGRRHNSGDETIVRGTPRGFIRLDQSVGERILPGDRAIDEPNAPLLAVRIPANIVAGAATAPPLTKRSQAGDEAVSSRDGVNVP